MSDETIAIMYRTDGARSGSDGWITLDADLGNNSAPFTVETAKAAIYERIANGITRGGIVMALSHDGGPRVVEELEIDGVASDVLAHVTEYVLAEVQHTGGLDADGRHCLMTTLAKDGALDTGYIAQVAYALERSAREQAQMWRTLAELASEL